MDRDRSRVGIILVALGFLGCSERVIMFVGAADYGPATSSASTTSSVASTGSGGAGFGGSGGTSSDAGDFGGSGGVAVGDAGPIACPSGPGPTHAIDTYADALAATSTHLYWLDFTQSAVMRQTKASGAREKLADRAARGRQIRVDDTRVFWEEETADRYHDLYGMLLDGSGGATRLAAHIFHWTVAGDRLFYWGSGTGEIDAVPKTGGGSTVVVSDALVLSTLAADDTGVYWYDGRADAGQWFMKFTFATSARGDFRASNSIRYLLADGRHVVWVDEVSYLGPASIRWSPPAGDTVFTIAGGQSGVVGLVADATTAYWLTGGMFGAMGAVDVVAAPFDGGPPRKLACNINMPIDLAVDDEAVYVSAGTSVVWKILKN